ncbi:MAG: peptidylprolyl isomerase [Planctomycetes bacterium]|nr:peptidylprolyl isomerase [Planctomycetota bacterium]
MLAFAFCCLLLPTPQAPTDVLATYELGGKPAQVTRTDVAVEMAFHLRRQDLGQKALDVLIDSHLTRKAAQQQGQLPTDAEVRKFWQDLQAELRAAGQRPEQFDAVRNTSEAELLEFLGLQLAQERLVRAELGLKATDKVSGDLLRLWLQEQRKQAKLVLDPDALPAGVAVAIDDTRVPMVDFGLLLLRTSTDAERDRFVQQVVYLAALEALARERGCEPTAAQLEAAIAKLAEDARAEPRYRGLPLEKLLEAQGYTLVSLQRSRVFRAKVALDLLAQQLHPDATLRAEVAADPAGAAARAGARRRLGVIFVRALDPPNALIPRSFQAAEAHLLQVLERLAKQPFAEVARIETEDPGSKPQGGDFGWHHRASERLPELVLDAGFRQANGEVSKPLRGPDGVYLVKVLDVEPEPDEATLLQRLRTRHAQELQAQILRDAKLRFPEARPARTAK